LGAFIAFLFIRHSNRDQDQLLAAFMAQKPAKRDTLSGHRTRCEGYKSRFALWRFPKQKERLL
jgi:hypothetical protein